MRDRETYDKYLDIPVSPEVREFLEENARELKRQRDHAYQYGVSCHACDTDKQNNFDTDSALCDMVYLDTGANSDSAEKAFFRQEAKIALAIIFLHQFKLLSKSQFADIEAAEKFKLFYVFIKALEIQVLF